MNFRKSILTGIAILFMSLTMPQQPANYAGPAGQSSAVVAFEEAERRGPDRQSLFLIAPSFGSYTIRSDGFVEAPGQYWHKHLTLQLGHTGFLDRIYFLEHESDLLLIYEVSNVESGWGYVMRLNQKTLKTRWILPVSAVNIERGLVEGEYLYIGATDQLAKIDLQTGAYVWQQLELKKKDGQPFGAFRLPSIVGDRIIFTEATAKSSVLELDKGTGKILNVTN